MKPGAQYYSIALIRDGSTDSNVIMIVLMDPSKTFICPEEARKVMRMSLFLLFFSNCKDENPSIFRGVCFGNCNYISTLCGTGDILCS